jgi:hypothetical protein
MNGAPHSTPPPLPASIDRLAGFSEADLKAALARKATRRPPLLNRLGASVAAAWRAVLRGAAPLDHPERAEPLERVLSAMPAWLVSVIVHTTMILLLGLIAVEVHRDQTSEMAVELAPVDENFKDEIFAEQLGRQLENPGPSEDNPDLNRELAGGTCTPTSKRPTSAWPSPAARRAARRRCWLPTAAR